MKRFLTLTLGAALAACLSLGAAAQAASTKATVGQPAPDFTLSDTNGQTHSLSDFSGKTVVLEWINHECPYVKKYYESGTMQSLQKDATGKDIVWLTVNSSAEGLQGFTTPEEANALIAEKGSAETARLLDTSGDVGRAYGAKTTPHMFIINGEGTLVYEGAIDDAPSADAATLQNATNYVTAALDDLAAGRPVALAQTKPYGCNVKYKE